MPRTPRAFEEKYPDFVGLAFDFSDPPPGQDSDEDTAREIRSDLPDDRRIGIFERLLSDSDRLLRSLEADFDSLQVYLNRSFIDFEEARDWLLKVQAVWRAERQRLLAKGH